MTIYHAFCDDMGYSYNNPDIDRMAKHLSDKGFAYNDIAYTLKTSEENIEKLLLKRYKQKEYEAW